MDFKDTIKRYQEIVNRELQAYIDNTISRIDDDSLMLNYSFTKDFVLGSGKRLRPISLIMAFKGISDQDEKAIYKPSLSVEFFHNSTLIHDDIMDEDDFRRNNPTVYKKYKDWFKENNKDNLNQGSLFNSLSSRFATSNAIICGNFLLLLGHSALKNNEKLSQIYNKAYDTVAEGQSLDMFASLKESITEKEYFDIISRKTAALFVASIEIGAILANASENQINNLKKFAEEAALAFQIKDDIMDISEESNKGHDLGSDIKKGKKTLLIIKSLDSSNKEEKEIILKTLGNENAADEDIKEVIDIIKSTGALDYAIKLSDEKINLAKEYLKKSEIKKESVDFFNNLAEFMIKRKK